MLDAIYQPSSAIAPRPTPDSVLFNDWHVVASASEIPPGTLRSVRLLGHHLVLWRGQSTTIQVWEDRCPHRSVQLSNGTVVDNTLVCPYHGIVYAASGQCIHVPAHPDYVPPKQARVHTYPVQERYGLVFVCLGTPIQEVPSFPEWDDATFVKGLSGPHAIQTGGYRAIENFLDIAHFPFVHATILGDPAKAALTPYEITVNGQGVHIPHLRVWQPNPLGTGKGAYVDYTYSVLRPLTAYLRKSNLAGECLSIFYCLTPVNEEECIGWMLLALNFIEARDLPEAIAFQDTVVGQDLVNLAAHTLKKLPLNPHTEFHVPCDRASLAYRQWLKQLGITYGVIG